MSHRIKHPCQRAFLLPVLAAAGFLVTTHASQAEEPGKVKWLDEFDVGEITSGWGTVRANQSVSNAPLSIGGERFERGVGVHASSYGYFILEGNARARFQAKVGVDDSPGQSGSVIFRVIADDEVIFDSGVMRQGDSAKEVDVDLSGKKVVELRVADAGDGINFDHANWVRARFMYSDEEPRIAPRWVMTTSHVRIDAAELEASGEPERAITSPDGRVEGRVHVIDGRLALQVFREGEPALDTSPLGVSVDDVDLGRNVEVGPSVSYSTDSTYPWLGNSAQLRDHSNGERISISTPTLDWTLDIRAYNDGVAWRYIIPGSGERRVNGEATSFVLPEGASYWSHHNTANYEANYLHFEVDGEHPSRPVTMPVTVELEDGGYAVYTESDMLHYSGMTFGPRGRVLSGIFEDDPSGWTMEGEFASPWRVVIATGNLTDLVNQSIVYNVNPEPDREWFPEGAHTDWIEPGRSYWTWGFGQWDTARWSRIKGYVDDAAALNCKYYVIDDPWREPRMGWHRNGGDEWDSLKEVTEYAAGKGVEIIVWEHWERIRDLPERERFFQNVADAGAAGVKLDFMDSESHERLQFYRSSLELGAEHEILINFHGSNKPAGEQRQYPHYVTSEGIYGMEQQGNIARQHIAALPFTRLVTGPGDFTPTAFRRDPIGNTTAGSQMAAAVAYNSPVNHWFESAETYLAQPEEVVEFIRTKPVAWDETLVLPGSEIGRTAVLARRKGDEWWIGGINGTDQGQSYRVDLDFLDSGVWDAVLFQDVEDDKTRLRIENRQVRATGGVNTRIAPGGGFVLIVKPRG